MRCCRRRASPASTRTPGRRSRPNAGCRQRGSRCRRLSHAPTLGASGFSRFRQRRHDHTLSRSKLPEAGRQVKCSETESASARAGFSRQPPSHAAPTSPSATSVENTPGGIKKYRQVRAAISTKHAANDHRTTGIAAKASRDIDPNCHARIAEKTRKTEAKNPNPLKKSQYERLKPRT